MFDDNSSHVRLLPLFSIASVSNPETVVLRHLTGNACNLLELAFPIDSASTAAAITPTGQRSPVRSRPANDFRIPRENTSIVQDSDAMVSIAMNDLPLVPKSIVTRRRRFQRGSLQKRKSGGCWNWIVFWWEDHHRKSQILGLCATMSRPEALAEMTRVLQPVNNRAGQPVDRVWKVGNWMPFFPSSSANGNCPPLAPAAIAYVST